MDPHTLLESFQAYSDSRRRLHVEEVEKPFDDVKESRLFETSYSKEEVQELIDDLASFVKNSVETEFKEETRVCVELLKRVLLSVERPVDVDFTTLDSQSSSGVDAARLTELFAKAQEKNRTGGAGSSLAPLQPRGQLPSLQPTKVADPETKKENEELKSKLTALQQQLVVIMREKSELKEKVFKLEDEIDAKEQTAGAGNSEREKELETKIDVLQDAVENSKMKIQRLEAELVAAKASGSTSQELQNEKNILQEQLQEQSASRAALEAELQGRLNECRPFLSMKKVLRTTTEQVRELQARLARYEGSSQPEPQGEDSDGEIEMEK